MAKQTINIGSAANDGTGDGLRSAFTKINENFTEVYTATATIPTDVSDLTDTESLLGGSADLGVLRISGSTIGTVDDPNTGGWGGYSLSLDPGGESSSGLYIPSPEGQQNGGSFQIYHTDADSGPLQLRTNAGNWELSQDGKLSGPAEDGTLQVKTHLSMNTDRGFVTEMGRFPMAINGDDWWFDVVTTNNDGYVYCLGGADIDNQSIIVKFDTEGNVVWQKSYTVPEPFNVPLIISADFKDANTITVVGNTGLYDIGTDTTRDTIISYEINTSDGSYVTDSGFALTPTDELENWTPYAAANQIRYNSGKTDYAIVGSKFGDSTDYTISAASAISTTPGQIKVSKTALDTAMGTNSPWTYNDSWSIRGYGFVTTAIFTDVTTETIEATEYYVLTTDTSVDFTTLPEGESWIIRYYDTETAYITTDNWSKKVDYLGQGQWFSSVGFDSSGNIYAGGASDSPNAALNETSLLVSFTSTGTVRWAKRIDDTNGVGFNFIQGLDVSSDNYIYTIARDDNGQTVIAKVSNAGAVSWIKTMTIDGGMSYHNNSKIIHIAADNSVVFAIQFNSVSSYNDDFLLAKLSSTGTLEWCLAFGSSNEESTNWDWGQDFLSADDNFIYVSGSRYTGNDDNAILFAIPHDGSVSGWVGIYNVRDCSNNIEFVDGSTLGTSVSVTTTTTTDINQTTYDTEALNTGYDSKRAYLNSGFNKVQNVAEIVFADGTTQRTSASDIPQTDVLEDNTITINAGHRGAHILVKAWINSTINVPTHYQDPLPIGTVVTIILDETSDYSRVFITGNSDEGNTVSIRPIGWSNYNNNLWSVGGDNVQGLYTLMKIEQNVWILSGATINNED